jgi:peptidoglycan/xylan/chitin deacetylase (PgdA/CDA1 family)
VQTRVDPAAGAKRVALTLDDGPDPRWTPVVLDLLRRHRVQATFCLVGTHVRQHPGLVRRIVKDGHVLCNHTWSHPMNLPSQPVSVVRQQLLSTQQAIASASGGVTPRYFRAPGGVWTPLISVEVARLGMTPLGWSVDPLDWARPPARVVIDRVLAGTRPGSIVLLHDGYGNRGESVAALRVILPTLLDRGFRFATP